ncbi:phospholipase C [Polyangium aurulentum]|uniref:phospholipase C n=1 Tax=Polyangium aurulentum TaxID=2567896 RepID=UPI0010AEBAF1|nr:alkaline phosphatase family protein [Polyangium aurulentum]UQA60085.1 alkaline phosphatase family protein [Polyangium aurulentum]
MRRTSCFLLALLPCLAQVACSVPDDGPAVVPPPPGPAEWNRDVEEPTDAEAETKRAACEYKSGALPAETQGESRPSGDEIPIDHIVVMMMENRSFDHYFQKLPEYGQPDVEVAPEGFTNPGPDQVPVEPFRDTQLCFVDTNHEWTGTHTQINGGKMDGFVTTNEGWHEMPAHGSLDMLSGKRAMTYYTADDLPFYYWLANEFAIADHYHASVPGPTWPNRMFLYGAGSFGAVHNVFVEPDKLLFDYLDLRQISWKIYVSTTAGAAIFALKYLDYSEAGHVTTIDDYFKDAAAGTLPQVAFVDPGIAREGYAQNDEHPPAIAMLGENFSATVVDALTKSPNWDRSALFITYDEHGGLFDHVVPPPACAPDDIDPKLEKDDTVAKFDQLGVRVPLIVVSPYAKKHFVGHRTYDHTSIVRFIEARFTMPALTNRDANAEAPWEMFDFENPPHADPPAITIPKIDQTKLDACKAIFEE